MPSEHNVEVRDDYVDGPGMKLLREVAAKTLQESERPPAPGPAVDAEEDVFRCGKCRMRLFDQSHIVVKLKRGPC